MRPDVSLWQNMCATTKRHDIYAGAHVKAWYDITSTRSGIKFSNTPLNLNSQMLNFSKLSLIVSSGLTRVLEKLAASKVTPYSENIPHYHVTILKPKILFLVTKYHPTLNGGGEGGIADCGGLQSCLFPKWCISSVFKLRKYSIWKEQVLRFCCN